uniref:NACHT domain-containing protein n=1 Tax=Heliothis virescens TaxID=7102 RepID=A0A2A4JIV3_HELVI
MEKYYKSFSEIRNKFQAGNEDKLFEGTSSDTQCLFVIYTTAKGEKNFTIYEGVYADILNDTIATADGATTPARDPRDTLLSKVILEDHMCALAQKMAKCIHGEIRDHQELSTDELVLRYHVVLAKTFFNISDDQSDGCRTACFKKDFLEEDRKDRSLILFKDELCMEMVKRLHFDNDDRNERCAGLDDCNFNIVDNDIVAMYRHIARSIVYKNRQFQFIHKTSSEKHKVILDKINFTGSNVHSALKEALSEYLASKQFKVPAWFGNKDLTLRGDEKKQERKLNDLTSKIVGLIKKASNNIIVIDESMGKGFLQLNGGIASAVGNLLVENPYPALKFTDEHHSLGKLAKKLYDKLQLELGDLSPYRFQIKVQHEFPKVTVCYPFLSDFDNVFVDMFFNNLLFYTSQLNEKQVEETLIYEISKCLPDDVQNEEITSNAIYLKYHDNIQKWWMSKDGRYLSKAGTLYRNAVEHTTSLPLTSVMNMMEKLKNNHYDFNENAIHCIPLEHQPSGSIVVTDSIPLTIAKLAKQLNNKNFIVLDLKYILNLTSKDDKILREELTNLKESKTIIVDLSCLSQKKNDLRSLRKLQELVKSIQRQKNVIVTEHESILLAKKYFPNVNNVVKDTTNNLSDMSEVFRTNVLEDTVVIFQGDEVPLSQVMDENSIGYVNGSVLNKLLLGDAQTLTIGQSIRNPNYRSKVYIEQLLREVPVDTRKEKKRFITDSILRRLFVTTPNHTNNKLTVIIGDAGIGKSTFLTYVSHRMKEDNQHSWIVRINLLEHCWQFSEWQDSKKRIDIVESVKFLCQVALSKNHYRYEEGCRMEITLEQSNGLFYLKDCSADEWTTFELKMFLHYCNTKQVLILLDGFDEICPMYEEEVTTFINILQDKMWQPKRAEIWITSRNVGNLDKAIRLESGMVHELQPIKGFKQIDYLIKHWDSKDLLKDLNDQQFANISDFVTFMSTSDDVFLLIKKQNIDYATKKEIPFLSVYLAFVVYFSLRLDDPIFQHFESHKDTLETLKKLNEFIYKSQLDTFVAIPLHLNMIADYLQNKIRETDKISNTWDLHTNIFDIYEGFFETKLKIRVQEKNKNDLYTPDNKYDFQEKYAWFIKKHKLFGAYAVFGKSLFDEDQLKNIEEMVTELKMDVVKTGVISNVVKNTPVFIHSTFAEYFAVEYIRDLLITETDRRFLWNFILNVMFFSNVGVLVLFDAKMKTDEGITALIIDDKPVICDLLMNPNVDKTGAIKTALAEAVRYNLRTLGPFLYSAVEENLTDSKLMDFIRIVKEAKIIRMAIKMQFEEIIVNITYIVWRVDKSKLAECFKDLKLTEKIENRSIDELIQMLHRHVWTRMGIVPDWPNLSQFRDILFI